MSEDPGAGEVDIRQGLAAKHVLDIACSGEGVRAGRNGKLALHKAAHCFVMAAAHLASVEAVEQKDGALHPRHVANAVEKLGFSEIALELNRVIEADAKARAEAAAPSKPAAKRAPGKNGEGVRAGRNGKLALHKAAHCLVMAAAHLASVEAAEQKDGALHPRHVANAVEKLGFSEIALELNRVIEADAKARAEAAAPSKPAAKRAPGKKGEVDIRQGLAAKHVLDIACSGEGVRAGRNGKLALHKAAHCLVMAAAHLASVEAAEQKDGALHPRHVANVVEKLGFSEIALELNRVIEADAKACAEAAAPSKPAAKRAPGKKSARKPSAKQAKP
ncbi:hypothetical protein DIPPA_29997 [Diplonema papillatum]|nr:hypothetical protein DIPPA_29997 [Diplonema papillatum]